MRACGVRQRHIDQAQSMNLYITNDYTLRKVLNLYVQAWENGVKTIYYVRSKSLEVEECESCSCLLYTSVDETGEKRLLNGAPVYRCGAADGRVRVRRGDVFLGVGRVKGGTLCTEKLFVERV